MYYCGIDIAKRSHSMIVEDEQGQVVEPVSSVNNDQTGFEQLRAVLARYPRAEVLVGLEATGHYWLALYDMLNQAGYRVVVINALQVHAYRKMDLRKRKTDKIDAHWVAAYLRFVRPDPTSPQLPVLLQLRELGRFRFWMTQQIGDIKRKVIANLDRVFPEYESFFSDVFLKSSRQLLADAVSAEQFAELDLHELSEHLHRASRGRLGQAKAEEIQAAARRSVGVAFLSQTVLFEVQCLLAQLDLLEEQRAAIDLQLEQLVQRVSAHLTTIPGVGRTTGAMILGEIGDVARFDSADKLVAYAGIDASVAESGEFQADQAHMSKRGSPYLRYAIWQAAVAALLHDAELKAYYDKKRAEGKVHGVAIGAVCRKLIHRIFIILKENRPYVPRSVSSRGAS
jgi:transposase